MGSISAAREKRFQHAANGRRARVAGEQARQRRKLILGDALERRCSFYGLTLDDYDRLLREQEGRCAICRGEFGWRLSVCIDHNHVTGVVRGLLCQFCNAGLGGFGDNLELFKAALDYVTNPPAVRLIGVKDRRKTNHKSGHSS